MKKYGKEKERGVRGKASEKALNPATFAAGVAPHAGAWIETISQHVYHVLSLVAPHAGAWIETIWSMPNEKTHDVAPHAGAWIETFQEEVVR